MAIDRRAWLIGAAGIGAGLGAATAPALADNAERPFLGAWSGVLALGSTRLRLRLEIAPGPTVTLFSLDQGGAPLPADEAAIEGARLTFAIAGLRLRYEGELRQDRIVGTLTQGVATPLTFERGEAGFASAAAPALTAAHLEALRTRAGAPAMAAAARGPEGRSLDLAVGLRAVDSEAAVTAQDHWHVGSITKSMTATLIARLAEAGHVRWDDTIADAFPALASTMHAGYRAATYRHLCSHRAGFAANLPRAALLQFPRLQEDARADRLRYAELALAIAPEAPLGARYIYSNTGFILAGAMLEQAMGAPWEALVQAHVFAPLGLASAGFGAPGSPGAVDQPVGHSAGLLRLRPHPPGDAITDNPAVLGPAGRVHMSLPDLLAYASAHRDRSAFLSAESWNLLHTPPFGGAYAMGWEVRAPGVLQHNGSNTLFYAELRVDQVRGVVAAAAANDGRLAQVTPNVGEALIGAIQAVA